MPPGGAACSLLPGEVRHSLANGAMEKGASASALSSTSGDEIVGKGGSRDPINSPKRTTFRVTCIRDLATRCYMLPTAIQSSSTIFMGQSQARDP